MLVHSEGLFGSALSDYADGSQDALTRKHATTTPSNNNNTNSKSNPAHTHELLSDSIVDGEREPGGLIDWEWGMPVSVGTLNALFSHDAFSQDSALVVFHSLPERGHVAHCASTGPHWPQPLCRREGGEAGLLPPSPPSPSVGS